MGFQDIGLSLNDSNYRYQGGRKFGRMERLCALPDNSWDESGGGHFKHSAQVYVGNAERRAPPERTVSADRYPPQRKGVRHDAKHHQ